MIDHLTKPTLAGKAVFSVGVAVCCILSACSASSSLPSGAVTPEQMEAADAGDAMARYALGSTYFQFQKFSDACHWLELSEAQGVAAADSLMQILTSQGHSCRPLRGSARAKAQATRIDTTRIVQDELRDARHWQHDAVLTYLDVEQNQISLLVVSLSAHQYLTKAFGFPAALPQAVQSNTITTPIPDDFISLDKAAGIARQNGLSSDLGRATLMTYQGPGGRALPAWLLVSADNERHWLIGAQDGRIYSPQAFMEASAVPQRVQRPQVINNNNAAGCTMARRMNYFDPCSRQGQPRNPNDDPYMIYKRTGRIVPP